MTAQMDSKNPFDTDLHNHFEKHSHLTGRIRRIIMNEPADHRGNRTRRMHVSSGYSPRYILFIGVCHKSFPCRFYFLDTSTITLISSTLRFTMSSKAWGTSSKVMTLLP